MLSLSRQTARALLAKLSCPFLAHHGPVRQPRNCSLPARPAPPPYVCLLHPATRKRTDRNPPSPAPRRRTACSRRRRPTTQDDGCGVGLDSPKADTPTNNPRSWGREFELYHPPRISSGEPLGQTVTGVSSENAICLHAGSLRLWPDHEGPRADGTAGNSIIRERVS
jgi:hypothetical protein